MIIRLATPADADELIRLYHGYLTFYRQPVVTERVAAYVAGMIADPQVLLVLAGDHEVTGFLTAFRLRNSLTQNGLLYVSDLFTDPARRGLGVASHLLARLAAEARAAGVDRCELSTACTNETAQRIYLSHGWLPDAAFQYFTLTP